MILQCAMLHIVPCRRLGGFESEAQFVNSLHSFSAGNNRSTLLEVVRAGEKRARVNKQSKKSGIKSISTPTDAEKWNGNTELNQSTLFSEDFSSTSLRNDDEIPCMEQGVSSNSTESSLDPTREMVLRACVVTCSGISAAGLLIQQASHWAAEAGWSFPDCTVLLSNHVEPWHLGVTMGLIVSVSSIRQFLLGVSRDFSESSRIANRRVLGPLSFGDIIIVAIVPGVSEELLFRGALLPCFGLDWKGAVLAGVLFGVLHISGGRNLAFAAWASFVGILYGLACVSTQTMLVPMAAHSVNNLVGALLWKSNEGKSSPVDAM